MKKLRFLAKAVPSVVGVLVALVCVVLLMAHLDNWSNASDQAKDRSEFRQGQNAVTQVNLALQQSHAGTGDWPFRLEHLYLPIEDWQELPIGAHGTNLYPRWKGPYLKGKLPDLPLHWYYDYDRLTGKVRLEQYVHQIGRYVYIYPGAKDLVWDRPNR